MCGVPLRVPAVPEAACLGAALLGGVAAGVYPDFAAAVDEAVAWRRQVAVDWASNAAYAPRMALYRQLYGLLAGILHKM